MSKKEKNDEICGFIDQGTEFNGNLKFNGTFRIDGNFKGKIVSNSKLIVGEKGKVEAEIDIGHLIVSGEVKGKINAKEKVEVYSKGKVYGDIITPKLMVEEGAFFHASCKMDGYGEKSPK
ncbi:polymer-forming cytoskeletal protein [SCandidatus Aminicenantes bacterium Aminicenantia_JdfR_composite]|jgi:cytoskeletal protein CcmA (bactofilin family)|nr:polymer-forming cytoskeletal protein [SCandidatus Aminicenantes bacterium Aminicenantia_JdfR_composite]MCP2597801.1 polymer-forming cytoskeletal protein [Candidatus Aminicenantes bacterium AC-335-L06]MCP2620526.1 polymer-forming cytoskeletal protein [Candidatus Aminicenantes bacterium AC-334-E05]